MGKKEQNPFEAPGIKSPKFHVGNYSQSEVQTVPAGYITLSQFKAKHSISPKAAEKYQQVILADEVLDDPALPDYKAVYRRLNQERNQPWKLNPSDIADFYLLEGVISRNSTEDYQEDPTNMAILKAKDRVTDIGKRLLVALTHEQLDEYDCFTSPDINAVPDDLKDKVHAFYVSNHDEDKSGATPLTEMNYYLSVLKSTLDRQAEKRDIMKIFSDKEMFNTALGLLASQQEGEWQVMAIAMRALLDKDRPLDELIKKSATIDSDNLDETLDKSLQLIEPRREAFLIDRLLNYTHNTGTMSVRVTNNIPQSIALLLAHGLPGHEKYLHYYSSLGYSTDMLGTLVRKSLPPEDDRNIVDDISTVVHRFQLPREYKYALLLQFEEPKLHNAVKRSTLENLSPTRVYRLLQKVSQHDGTSTGILKNAT